MKDFNQQNDMKCTGVQADEVLIQLSGFERANSFSSHSFSGLICKIAKIIELILRIK